ncbi:MAG: DUF4258 domain-containing protein [Dehalococcoidia bacterium]
MKVPYTKHADFKFQVLKEHGFTITREQIEDIIKRPEKIVLGKRGRSIAHKSVSQTHLVRLIYEQHDDDIKVITFCPARRERYED